MRERAASSGSRRRPTRIASSAPSSAGVAHATVAFTRTGSPPSDRRRTTSTALFSGGACARRTWSPVSSIRHGLAALGGASHAAILPVDHPGIRTRTLDALFLHARNTPDRIVVPTWEGRRGHPGVFPAARFPDLMAAPDEEGARAVLRSHANLVLEVRVDDPAVVRDLDTPEDLAGS